MALKPREAAFVASAVVVTEMLESSGALVMRKTLSRSNGAVAVRDTANRISELVFLQADETRTSTSYSAGYQELERSRVMIRFWKLLIVKFVIVLVVFI